MMEPFTDSATTGRTGLAMAAGGIASLYKKLSDLLQQMESLSTNGNLTKKEKAQQTQLVHAELAQTEAEIEALQCEQLEQFKKANQALAYAPNLSHGENRNFTVASSMVDAFA